MKGFICKNCGFVSIDDSLPERCPVCGAPKASFVGKEDAVKTSSKPGEMTEPDRKHIPYITIKKKCEIIPENCVDVNVKVGEILHPMITEHYITHIDFYIDKKFVSRIKLTPEKMNPAVTLHLKSISGLLTAIEHCNIHGNWIKEVQI